MFVQETSFKFVLILTLGERETVDGVREPPAAHLQSSSGKFKMRVE